MGSELLTRRLHRLAHSLLPHRFGGCIGALSDSPSGISDLCCRVSQTNPNLSMCDYRASPLPCQGQKDGLVCVPATCPVLAYIFDVPFERWRRGSRHRHPEKGRQHGPFDRLKALSLIERIPRPPIRLVLAGIHLWKLWSSTRHEGTDAAQSLPGADHVFTVVRCQRGLVRHA